MEGCRQAAELGLRLLEEGESPLTAAQRAVEYMEDDPLFNAATGGALTSDGTLELDASLMDGTTMRAGAVCALPPHKNPIRIARAVLEDGSHVLYAAEGAARFALTAGFEPASAETMVTESARNRLELHRKGQVEESWAGGTVGAVAYADGHVAAATSTGGTVGSHPGRVGDSPVLGAGTYADDEAGGCSATGIGEDILRACLVMRTMALMEGGVDAQAAADEAMRVFQERFAGSGGIIVLDREGRDGIRWNTATMSHAVARAGEPTRCGS